MIIRYHYQNIKAFLLQAPARAAGEGRQRGREMVTASNRKTRQRDALVSVLERAERPLSVAELLEAASKRIEGLGVATVYRAVGALLDDGRIEAVEIPGEPTRYERSDKGHHHHFQCEKCERVFDIAGCLDNLRKLVPPKFRVKEHSVMLYGVCATCAR
jgi:Fur family ferric uptake transcriptional regulator